MYDANGSCEAVFGAWTFVLGNTEVNRVYAKS